MIKKYMKKPITIEAVQWTGNNYSEIAEFMGKMVTIDLPTNSLIIGTLEGDMKASIDDFIIRGIQGEFYPCKPDIFIDTYDEIQDD